ncbi:uncharacterized protein RHO25_006006 [Cercospora beticola]|uniref:BTB domain-containing protein n=1 Tax=Cercospora beticola TaxID=122368 RepID=A0ABZ0NPG6_CERBT|nr:hypothetical protein RHO25_006006 [Cercospora beticola]
MANGTVQQHFCNRLEDFFGKDDLTDFVIVCGEQEFEVHRLVLALHSDVLFKACTGGFKESHERKIDLTADHEPIHIAVLVEYMYTFGLCVPVGKDETLDFLVHMAILADKYNMKHLHEEATSTFKMFQPICRPAIIANAAELAYDAPAATSEIREAICSQVAEHKEWLRNEDGKPLVQTMEEVGSFAVDVAKRIAMPAPPTWTKSSRKCPLCRTWQQFPSPLAAHRVYTCDTCPAASKGSNWLLM